MRIISTLYRAVPIPMELPTHTQQIKNLYKRMVRNIEDTVFDIEDIRFEAVVLRSKFDEHKHETDVIKIKHLMQQAEKHLWDTQSPNPFKFPTSPGGSAFEREVVIPDWVLDYWHPLERAQYPDYFAKREQRKKEFVIWWEKQYGKPNPSEGHH